MTLEAIKFAAEYSLKLVPAIYNASKYAVAYVVNKVAQMSFKDLLNALSLLMAFMPWSRETAPTPIHPSVFVVPGVTLWIFTIGLMYFGPAGCKSASSPGFCDGVYYSVITICLLGGLGLIGLALPKKDN